LGPKERITEQHGNLSVGATATGTTGGEAS
jgi:hypothetical protein